MTPATARRAKAPPSAELVEAMKDYQTRYSLSDGDMAKRIGVPRTTWTAIRVGQYTASLSFARKAYLMPEFRHLAQAVLLPPLP